MKNTNLNNLISEFRSLELKAHVNLDDVINKVTQEVSELVEAIMNGDLLEMKKEAADSLANIISASVAMGVEFESRNGEFKKGEVNKNYGPLFVNMGKWNQDIQALRGRYSRDIPSLENLSKSTNILVGNILDYVDPNVSLSDIMSLLIAKFSSRTDAYKSKINLDDYIDNYSNFPCEGIEFKDISPILKSEEAMKYICFEMAQQCKDADIIAGLDARGFLFGVKIAEILGKPFVMIRKKLKLPGKTVGIDYSLEYGKNEIEIQENSIKEGQRVALIDDLLATGGTILAASALVEKLGGIVNNISFVISLDDKELKNSPARDEISKYKVDSVVKYN